MSANTDGVVMIHGKEYQTVAYRVHRFREEHPDWTIETQLIMQDDEKVIMKALIYSNKTLVLNAALPDDETEQLHLVATGYAEEVRASSKINETSCMEVCETSAIGRALAALGLAGTEYASADEVAGAISQQGSKEHIEYMELVREHWESIVDCKAYLIPAHGPDNNQHNVTAARECLKELGDDVYRQLWRAPSKGGCLTTLERKLLKEPPEDSL